MKEKILKIIWDNLSTHNVTMGIGITNPNPRVSKNYEIASVDLLVANMICGVLQMKDINLVIELGKFIQSQWTDLEFSDENAEIVFSKTISMWKEYNNHII
jgi:hypothetical protein